MLRLLALLLFPAVAIAQQIYAPNDNEKSRPFTEAYEQRADFIEVSVWLVNGKLVVADALNKVDTIKTLEALYLNPILKLFEQYKDHVSQRRDYTFSLVINIKDDFEKAIPKLVTLLEPNLGAFHRGIHPSAVRIVITGNRPKAAALFDYPAFLFFDGSPSEIYDTETLQRIALVSDNFQGFSRWDGTGNLPDVDRDKLKRVIRRAHDDGKPFRFRNIPDMPNAWKQLRKAGVDVITTDKVAEATADLK